VNKPLFGSASKTSTLPPVMEEEKNDDELFDVDNFK